MELHRARPQRHKTFHLLSLQGRGVDTLCFIHTRVRSQTLH